ncbi:MAG TPA: hypothetical protein ENJ18_08005 [Nannocystis exedens]|nr:hypothetical protein [Nannocystis exedens]
MRSFPSLALSLAFVLSAPLVGACTGSTSETDTSNTSETSESESDTSDTDTDTDTGGEDVKTQLCGSGDKTEGTGTNLMETWGAPCSTDDECTALIGEGAVCLTDILDIYILQQGYCSRLCELTGDDRYVKDDPTCGAGITCLGQDMFFETCAPECTSDDECQRDGYTCQTLPTIGAEGDPKFCLMATQCTMACVADPSMAGCS